MEIEKPAEIIQAVAVPPLAVCWMVEKEKGGGWIPLWSRDSQRLEDALASGESNTVTIYATKACVSLDSRELSYTYWTMPPKKVIRGTWFYKNIGGDVLPHDESQSEAMEIWFQDVLVESSSQGPTESFRRERDFDGTYSVTLVAERESTETLAKRKGTAVSIPWQKSDEPNPLPDGLTISQFAKGSWPRFPVPIKRGWAGPAATDECVGNYEVGHLVFVIHGIGEAMFSKADSPLPSLKAVTQSFTKMTLDQQLKAVKQSASHPPSIQRIEYLPIEWFAKVHSEEVTLSTKIQRITLPTIPFFRSFANDVTLDVLLYLHTEFQQRIITEVCTRMNELYDLFRANNPSFNGSVSIVGHSLGTVIAFDVLSRQFGLGPDPTPNRFGSSGNGLQVERLRFCPRGLYALGSPLGLFFAMRNQDLAGFRLPSCSKFFNIFHPYDPVAYRIEPLLSQTAQTPALVPHHAASGGLRVQHRFKKMSQDVSQGVQGTLNTVAGAFSNMRNLLSRPTASKVVASAPEGDDVQSAEDPAHVALNSGDRVDWELQASAIEDASEYIAALGGHSGYFDNEDVALFLMKRMLELD